MESLGERFVILHITQNALLTVQEKQLNTLGKGLVSTINTVSTEDLTLTDYRVAQRTQGKSYENMSEVFSVFK